MTDRRHGFGGRARLVEGFGAAGLIGLAAAIGLSAFGVVKGTWAVGGSDSSCYALMAQAFANGELQPRSPLVTQAPWPNAAVTFAPGGFIPSAVRADAAAPICAPGMSVLMAPLAAVFGKDAVFWLTPIAAFVLVISAFALATQLAGSIAGATAAILTATSPIVLYQAVQPMNDILTAALWLAALAGLRRPATAGVLIGLAILVRPNLAPLALVIAAAPILAHGVTAASARAIALMTAGALPSIAGLLWMNAALYGSPLASGYGDAARLFSVGHVNDNLSNYGRALWHTQYAVPALGLLAPLVFEGGRQKLSALVVAFAACVVAIYLLYTPFPEWWYLRFLIPAIVVLLVLASAVGVTVLSNTRTGGLIPIAAVILGILGTRVAADRDALALQEMEGRYRRTAELVRDRLPSNAVLITEWQSGSVRFHAGRDAVLWQSLDPAWLDRALAWLQSNGLHPYLLVERREEQEFRARFRDQSNTGRLDWPPRFDLNRQVRIFDPADRARYLSGEGYPTENVRPPARSGR